MKHVKWIFIFVLTISSLTSFVAKDKPTSGLGVGDLAPDFRLPQAIEERQQPSGLADLRGRYVLLSFWASYDAASRMRNATLSNVLRMASPQEVEMVSVSFDEYQSVFLETVRKDRIAQQDCFVETAGTRSDLFSKYRLNKGFTNYLIDGRGVIIAKDLTARQLYEELERLRAAN